MLDKTQRWIDISEEDLSMAEISFAHGRYLHMAFFCQQSIEKAIKGLYFEKQQQTPPRKHTC
jgi:HEPN domain-containing protein